MKYILLAVTMLLSIFGYSQEINGSAPNKYTGQTFTAASASADAVNVNRYDTVTFIGCTFNGLLRGSGGSNIKAIGCTFNGIAPTNYDQWNRGIDVYMPQALYVYNCTFNHTAGIRVDHRNQNTNSIVISHSRFYNIDARNGQRNSDNPYGTYNGQQRAAILIDGCVGINGEISWNYIYNAPDSSCVEDNINLRNSGGYTSRLFPVTHNYIDGAYSWPVSLTSIPSVSGITFETGDENTYEKVSQFARADSNYIVRRMNGGINMTSTHDCSSTGNVVVSSGKLPDGRQSFAFWSALAIFNGSSLPTTIWKNNKQVGNRIALVRPGASNGGVDRNDVSTPETIALSDNFHIPNPITKATEDSQLLAWVADTLRAAGVTVPTSPTPVGKSGFKIKFVLSNVQVGIDTVNGIVSGRMKVVDDSGNETNWQRSSLVFTSSVPAVATVAPYTTDSTLFYITPNGPGTANINVSLKTHLGNTISTSFALTITALIREAKSILLNIVGAK